MRAAVALWPMVMHTKPAAVVMAVTRRSLGQMPHIPGPYKTPEPASSYTWPIWLHVGYAQKHAHRGCICMPVIPPLAVDMAGAYAQRGQIITLEGFGAVHMDGAYKSGVLALPCI